MKVCKNTVKDGDYFFHFVKLKGQKMCQFIATMKWKVHIFWITEQTQLRKLITCIETEKYSFFSHQGSPLFFLLPSINLLVLAMQSSFSSSWYLRNRRMENEFLVTFLDRLLSVPELIYGTRAPKGTEQDNAWTSRSLSTNARDPNPGYKRSSKILLQSCKLKHKMKGRVIEVTEGTVSQLVSADARK